MLETPSNKGTSVDLGHIYNSFQRYLKKDHSKGHENTPNYFFFHLYFWKIMKMKLDIHFYLQLKKTTYFSFNNFTRFRFHEAMMQYTSQH